MNERLERTEKANSLLVTIAGCGRKFFYNYGRTSFFKLDGGKVWFFDSYTKKRIYTNNAHGNWMEFYESGRLRELVIKLRDFILYGKPVVGVLGPFPDWYSAGDPWGYGDDFAVVLARAAQLGIVSNDKASVSHGDK